MRDESTDKKSLKAIFCHQKMIKKQKGLVWNFLQHSIQVCRGAYIPYFKIVTIIFCCLFFSKNISILRSGSTKWSFPSRKGGEVFWGRWRGEGWRAEKITKTKHERVLVTSFYRYHYLWNLYIFGFCFVVP